MGRPPEAVVMPSTMLYQNSSNIPSFSDAPVFVRGYGSGVISINLPQKNCKKKKARKYGFMC